MKQSGIDIEIVHRLVVQNQIFLSALRFVGYTPIELKPLTTINQLLTAGYTINELKNVGYTSIDFKNENIDFKTLDEGGYSVYELYEAGFAYTDFFNNGYQIVDLINAGITAKQINEMEGIPDISLYDYVVNYHISLNELLDAGYSINDIIPFKTTYFSIIDFINNGYSINYLYENGFSIYDFYAGYFSYDVPSLSELLSLNYHVSRLIPYDISILSYYQSNYSSRSLYENGFLVSFIADHYSLAQLKLDGIALNVIKEYTSYTIRDFIDVGYTIRDFKTNGVALIEVYTFFSLVEIKGAGYTLGEIVAIQFYSIKDLVAAKFTSFEIQSFFTIEELLAMGFSKRELNIDGNVIKRYCSLKKSCVDIVISKLNSSTNQKQISSKMRYSQDVRNRKSSYSLPLSTYFNNVNVQDNVENANNPYRNIICLDNSTQIKNSSVIATSTFTGSISGTTLTVTEGSGILIKMNLFAEGLSGNIHIMRQIQNRIAPGYSGGVGTYEVSSSEIISSRLITGKLIRNSPSIPKCQPGGKPKTDASFSFFIRNYIIDAVRKKYPNVTDQELQNYMLDIKNIKNVNPDTSIYDIISEYLY
jgi:hypothetical protein